MPPMKINFEKYFAEIAQSSLVIQPLMVPQVMDLSIEDYGVYINNQAVLAAAGFSIRILATGASAYGSAVFSGENRFGNLFYGHFG